LNRFLLRLPYGSGEGELAVKDFNYQEDVTENASQYLWGNPAYGFLANINRSFAKHGWAVNIRGSQSGGRVEDLPVHSFVTPEGSQIRIPTEAMIPETPELNLSNNGLIPLCVYKNTDYAVFFGAQSVQKPKEDPTDPYATANNKLSANLPYLFLVSRLGHYQKVMLREIIGSQKEKDDLQAELNTWIRTLVTEDVSPTPEKKAECPLRAASIVVTEKADSPGFYHVTMQVRPHFQVEGVNVDLSLVTRVPTK
jgi:type VI secretion system protein ImpC